MPNAPYHLNRRGRLPQADSSTVTMMVWSVSGIALASCGGGGGGGGLSVPNTLNLIITQDSSTVTTPDFVAGQEIAAGTMIYQVAGTATDDITGTTHNDDIVWELTDDAGGLFAVDSTTGIVSLVNALTPVAGQVYGFEIEARVGVSSETHSITFDNNAPAFTAPDGGVAIDSDEDTAGGTSLYTAQAADADGDTVTYSIDVASQELFTIDAASGEIRLKSGQNLDFEDAESNQITITAMSTSPIHGSTEKTATEMLTINVQDVDDITLTITQDTSTVTTPDFLAGQEIAAGAIYQVAGTATDDITGTTHDDDITGTTHDDDIIWELTDDASGLFVVDSTTGIVSLANALTPVAGQVYGFEIEARVGVSSETRRITFDNNAPAFTAPDGGVAIGFDEDTAGGTSLYTAQAADADGDTVTYSIDVASQELFTIDATSGEIRLKTDQNLDFEDTESHQITITAMSTSPIHGSAEKATTEMLTINVQDLDDITLTIAHDTSTITIPDFVAGQEIEAGTMIYQVAGTATDDITGTTHNDDIVWELTDDAGGLFAVDSTTGIVSLVNALTPVAGQVYSLEIEAHVGVSTETHSITFDSNAPAFTAPDGGAAVDFDEDTASNTLLYTAQAEDADGDDVTYSIDAASQDLFTIDATSGEIRLKSGQNLDFEDTESHQITITAMSTSPIHGSTEKTATEMLTINVQDLDDITLTITHDTSTVTTPDFVAGQEIEAGTMIYQAAGTATDDITGTTHNDDIVWELTDDASGLFVVDSTTGIVSLANALTPVVGVEYAFEIVATVGVSRQTHLVTFPAPDNHAPIFIAPNGGETVDFAEDTASGTLLYTVQAADADGDTVTYDIDAASKSLFYIDTDTGAIKLKDDAQLDFETASSHQITITAMSTSPRLNSQTKTDTETLTINVQDRDDITLMITHDTSTISTPDFVAGQEIAAGAIYQVAGTATDKVTGTPYNDDIVWTFTDASGLFTFDSATRTVRLTNSLTPVADTTYSFDIIATVGASSETHSVMVVVPASPSDPVVSFRTREEDISGQIAFSDPNQLSATTLDLYALSIKNPATFTLDFRAIAAGETGMIEGTYGDFRIERSEERGTANWLYIVNYNDEGTRNLRRGDIGEEILEVTVYDEGGQSSETQQITLTVTGVNDRPFLEDPNGATILVGHDNNPTVGSLEGQFALASDIDEGDTHSFSVADAVADTNRSNFTHRVDGTYGQLYFNTTGQYEYVFDDTLTIANDASELDAFMVSVIDNSGAANAESVKKSLIFTINGQDNAQGVSRFVPPVDSAETPIPTTPGSADPNAPSLTSTTPDDNTRASYDNIVRENVSTYVLGGTITLSDSDDAPSALTLYAEAGANPDNPTESSITSVAPMTTVGIAGTYGIFTLIRDIFGQVTWEYALKHDDPMTQALAEDAMVFDRLKVRVYDDDGNASGVETLMVDVRGRNDYPLMADPKRARIIDNAEPETSLFTGALAGIFEVTDDRDDTHTFWVKGALEAADSDYTHRVEGEYGVLYFNADGADAGRYIYERDEEAISKLLALEIDHDEFTITATDNRGIDARGSSYHSESDPRNLIFTIIGVDDTLTASQATPPTISEALRHIFSKDDFTIVDGDRDVEFTLMIETLPTLGKLVIDDGTGEVELTESNRASRGIIAFENISTLIYRPEATDADYAATFTYRISNGTDTYPHPVFIASTFRINVTEDNPATVLELDASAITTLPENTDTANGVRIGTIMPTDADGGDYGNLELSGTNAGHFELQVDDATGDIELWLTGTLDFETNPSLSVRVQLDQDTSIQTAPITITVTDANDAPILGGVDSTSQSGQFTATDEDSSDTLTFVVTDGTVLTAPEVRGGVTYTHSTAGTYGTLYYNDGSDATSAASDLGQYIYERNDTDLAAGTTESDRFEIVVSDNNSGTSSPQYLTMTVNGTPQISIEASTVSVDEDEMLEFSEAQGNGLSVSGLGGLEITQVTISVNQGQLTTGGQQIGAYMTESVLDGDVHALTFTNIDQQDLNALLEGLIYRPDTDYNGTDSLRLTIESGDQTYEESIAITVAPVDDPIEIIDFGGKQITQYNRHHYSYSSLVTQEELDDATPGTTGLQPWLLDYVYAEEQISEVPPFDLTPSTQLDVIIEDDDGYTVAGGTLYFRISESFVRNLVHLDYYDPTNDYLSLRNTLEAGQTGVYWDDATGIKYRSDASHTEADDVTVATVSQFQRPSRYDARGDYMFEYEVDFIERPSESTLTDEQWESLLKQAMTDLLNEVQASPAHELEGFPLRYDDYSDTAKMMGERVHTLITTYFEDGASGQTSDQEGILVIGNWVGWQQSTHAYTTTPVGDKILVEFTVTPRGNPGPTTLSRVIITDDVVSVIDDGAWDRSRTSSTEDDDASSTPLIIHYTLVGNEADLASVRTAYGLTNENGRYQINLFEHQADKDILRAAFDSIQDVANIEFREQETLDGDITDMLISTTRILEGSTSFVIGFSSGGPGNFGRTIGHLSGISSTHRLGVNGRSQEVFIHEILHNIGLNHPGLQQPSVDPIPYLTSDEATLEYTIMAYRSGLGIEGPQFYPQAPQIYDIETLQQMYGANLTTRSGDTIYDFTESIQHYEVIYDTGGIDTFNFNNPDFESGINLGMTAGARSTIATTKHSWNFFIAQDVVDEGEIILEIIIENAIGTRHDDIIRANKADNILEGLAGADILDGREGMDTASYSQSESGVTVDLTMQVQQDTGVPTNHASGDTLISIENIIGSAHDDALTGNQDHNRLEGGGGNDTLAGGEGKDMFVVELGLGKGIDTITDFQRGIDKLILEVAETFSDFVAALTEGLFTITKPEENENQLDLRLAGSTEDGLNIQFTESVSALPESQFLDTLGGSDHLEIEIV